uniref:Uncharacterized protein n=1 Tax=Anguilla anguilla TaxID=7936 RepID=A0A0E9PL28_ANGAN
MAVSCHQCLPAIIPKSSLKIIPSPPLSTSVYCLYCPFDLYF